jgi:hypothetical protein
MKPKPEGKTPKIKLPQKKPKTLIKETWFDKVQEDAMTGNYSNPKNLVEITRPEAAALALELLSHGMSANRVSKKSGLNRETVRQLAWRNSDTLQTKRKEISKKYAQAAEAYTELLMDKADQLFENPDELSKLSPEKLAITIGVMTDKSMVLEGMAGVVHEHRKGASIADAVAMIAASKARVAGIEPVIVDAEIL